MKSRREQWGQEVLINILIPFTLMQCKVVNDVMGSKGGQWCVIEINILLSPMANKYRTEISLECKVGGREGGREIYQASRAHDRRDLVNNCIVSQLSQNKYCLNQSKINTLGGS